MTADTMYQIDTYPGRFRHLNRRQQSVLLLLAVVMLAAFVRWLFLNGPAGSDDTRYMNAAVALAHGDPPAGLDHANVRASFLVWVAAWSWLGLPASHLVLSQVAASAIQAGALFWVARMLTDERSALIASVLWIFFPVELTYGGVLTPDQFSVALGLISLGLVLRGLREPTAPILRYGLLAGVMAALAYSAKEPFFLLSVILGGWSIARIGLSRRVWSWHAYSVAGFLIVVILEHVFYAVWTGDWLYKYHALFGAYGPGGEGRVPVSLGALIYYPRQVLANFEVSGFFGWLLIIGLLASGRKVRCWQLVFAWSALFFVFLQFGSSGVSEYSLLPMQPRYVGPFVVLLFIPLGLTVRRLTTESPLRRSGTAVLFSAIVYHGAIVARERMSLGLYYTALPASVTALLGDPSNRVRHVVVPPDFRRTLPSDLRSGTSHWREADIKAFVMDDAASTAEPCPCTVLIPEMPSTSDLRDWLVNVGLQGRPVVVPISPLDVLLNKARLPSLNARAQTRVVGHLF